MLAAEAQRGRAIAIGQERSGRILLLRAAGDQEEFLGRGLKADGGGSLAIPSQPPPPRVGRSGTGGAIRNPLHIGAEGDTQDPAAGDLQFPGGAAPGHWPACHLAIRNPLRIGPEATSKIARSAT